MPEQVRAAVQLLAEHRLRLVEIARHLGVLVAQAREHEGHRTVTSRLYALPQQSVWIPSHERLSRVGSIATNKRLPMSEGLAADLQGVRDIGQLLFGMAAQVRREAVRGCLQGGLGVPRQHDELPRPGRVRRGTDGGLRKDDVGVRAAGAKRADPGPPGGAVCLPLGESGVDVERRALKVDLWIRSFAVEAGRDQPVLQRKDGLDKPSDPGSRMGMPDVGLDRADRAEARPFGTCPEGAGERFDLNRVTQGGTTPWAST